MAVGVGGIEGERFVALMSSVGHIAVVAVGGWYAQLYPVVGHGVVAIGFEAFAVGYLYGWSHGGNRLHRTTSGAVFRALDVEVVGGFVVKHHVVWCDVDVFGNTRPLDESCGAILYIESAVAALGGDLDYVAADKRQGGTCVARLSDDVVDIEVIGVAVRTPEEQRHKAAVAYVLRKVDGGVLPGVGAGHFKGVNRRKRGNVGSV